MAATLYYRRCRVACALVWCASELETPPAGMQNAPAGEIVVNDETHPEREQKEDDKDTHTDLVVESISLGKYY